MTGKAPPMTTRDDLVKELRWPTGVNSPDLIPSMTVARVAAADMLQADAAALEAKDAEIARLTESLTKEIERADLAMNSIPASSADRITDLERQLAEETERCAQTVYGAVGMIPMGQVDASEFLDKIEDAIAAAIRGGSK